MKKISNFVHNFMMIVLPITAIYYIWTDSYDKATLITALLIWGELIEIRRKYPIRIFIENPRSTNEKSNSN